MPHETATNMKTVSFKQMKDGTKADYALLEHYEEHFVCDLPARILETLKKQANGLSGYQIDRLTHSLQTATRAQADGADIDWIVCALVHDIGDDLAPLNHSAYAAEVLQPYVREECTWVVRHHGVFQYAYYGDKVGLDVNARDAFKDHPCYDACVLFCERWDQASFDLDYPTKPLSYFAPLVEEVFTRRAWREEILQAGQHVPLVSLGRQTLV